MKGDPGSESAIQEEEGLQLCIFTELNSEDVTSVLRFDEHDLILVGQIKRLGIIQSDGKVECGGVNLRYRRELGDAQVRLGNQLCPPESELCIGHVTSRNEDRAVIDGNRNYFFGFAVRAVPERRREKRVTETSVLGLVQQ